MAQIQGRYTMKKPMNTAAKSDVLKSGQIRSAAFIRRFPEAQV